MSDHLEDAIDALLELGGELEMAVDLTGSFGTIPIDVVHLQRWLTTVLRAQDHLERLR